MTTTDRSMANPALFPRGNPRRRTTRGPALPCPLAVKTAPPHQGAYCVAIGCAFCEMDATETSITCRAEESAEHGRQTDR